MTRLTKELNLQNTDILKGSIAITHSYINLIKNMIWWFNVGDEGEAA